MAGGTILSKLLVLISGDTAQFVKSSLQAQSSLKALQTTAQTANNILKTFGLGFAGYQVFNAFKSAVGVLSEFQHSMQEVRAITGATSSQFKALTDDALRLGASTKFTASQVAQLQVAYGRLGFNTKEIIDATSATLDLAAATGEDLAKSADVAGSTVRAFGLDAKETQRVVDVMASSFNKSALQLDNFAESMSYVAPIAAAANISVEETTALLSTLADAGIRGSKAGTGLRRIITDLAKDGRPLSERLKELSDRGLTFSGAMDEVGRFAQSSLLVLAKNTEKTEGLATAYNHAAGEAAKMARIMQDDLQGDVTKLTSAFQGLILTVGDTKNFRNLTQNLTDLVNVLSGSGRSIDRIFKEIAYTLTQSGDLSNFSINDVKANLKQYVIELERVRKETGKPIDVSQVEYLAEKYGLSSKAVQFLRMSIEEANKSLSFQERAVKRFNEFTSSSGYDNLNQGAEAYISKINELIVAETNRQEKFKQGAIDLNTGAFGDQIKQSEEQIAVWLREIDVIKQLSVSSVAAQAEIDGAIKNQSGLIQSLEDHLKILEDGKKQAFSTDAIIEFNSKIKETKDEIDALNASIKLSGFGKQQLQNAQAGLPTNVQGPSTNIPQSELNFPTAVPVPDVKPAIDALELYTDAIKKSGAASIESIDQQILQHNLLIDKLKQQGETAVAVGSIIVDSVGDVLSGQKTLVQGLAQATTKILSLFLARALGSVIDGSIESSGGNPYIGIALAAASVAAVSALFSSATGHAGGSGGGGGGISRAEGVQRVGTTQSAATTINFDGEFVVRGGDLVLALNNQNSRSQRTG